jgi:hypothetical protein
VADINVERKGPSIWPWIIGLIVLALLIWALTQMFGRQDTTTPVGAPADTFPVDTPTTTVAPGIPQTTAPGVQPTDTVPGATTIP